MILLKRVFILLFVVFPIALTGQNLSSTPDLENFKKELINDVLVKKLNELRAEKGLHPLKYNDKLEVAAEDQAVYNRKNSDVGFEQSSKKKSTPFARVAYYGGFFEEVEEYDLGFEVQVKRVLNSNNRRRTNPSTYQEIVDHIAQEWIDERKKDEFLFDDKFYQIGFGFAPNSIDNLLFVSIVVATEEYEKYSRFKYHKKSYNVSPYDRNTCKEFDRNFDYLSELLSDNLIIKKNAIYFYYHDLSLIESILQSNKDAFAIDIVQNEQYSCNHGNSLHPSLVYDGMMTKPLKKSKILKANRLKEQKEFLVKMASLPPGLDTNEISLSLIAIQNKCACKKIVYNNLNGQNIRLLDIDLVVDTISISASIDSNSRYLQFTVPFEKNKSDYLVEDIKPFLDSIQLNRFNIKEIAIKAYSSVEGNPINNKDLAEKRAESILLAIKEYQLQEVQTKIETEENWDGFYSSINASPYSEEFKNKDHNAVRDMLNTDSLPYDIEPYLEDQRKAEIKIFVESIFIDSLEAEYLSEKFSKSLKKEEFVRAKALQTLMYRAVLNGELDKEVLFADDIPQFKEYIPLSNNRLAFYLEFIEDARSDSSIDALRMEVEALLGVDPKNGHVNFNKQAIKLYYWSKDLNILIIDEENRVNQVKDFYRDIKRLYNTKIDNYYVNRLLMNYNIIAADYYYEKQDYKNRVKALKEVRKYVKKAKLNRGQTFAMARYFIYQMQIDWAIEIMKPYVNENNYDVAFLQTFLSIAGYDEKHVKEDYLKEQFEVMSEKFPEQFCKMFGQGGMGIEFLSDIRLKSIYCNTCH